MAFKRLIPVLLLKNGRLVRSQNFSYHQLIGDPYEQTNRYKSWDVDELIYLDITHHWLKDMSTYFPGCGWHLHDILPKIAHNCFNPLSVGGGIKTVEDIHKLINLGADRVILNTGAIENPQLVEEAAKTFGSQAIIVAIDAGMHNGTYTVFSHAAKRATGLSLKDWVKKLSDLGASEIFLNSFHKDGLATGYDVKMIESLGSDLNTSLIVSGGVGCYEDFAQVANHPNVRGVAAANLFAFKELSYQKAKNHLLKKGFLFRKSVFCLLRDMKSNSHLSELPRNEDLIWNIQN